MNYTQPKKIVLQKNSTKNGEPIYDKGTVPQKPTNDDCFQTYVLRFKYHLFSQTISNCIFTQFIGFSYLTTKYFLKCSAIYSKILVVEYMMDIFELFINKLASISQNCYYFFFHIRQGFVGFEIEKML